MEMASDNERATVALVYRVVNETRTELGDKIDDLAEKVDQVVVSHEHRLTTQESLGRELVGRVSSVEARTDSLRSEHDVFRGHIKALGIVAAAVITLCAGGLATVVADMVSKIH
jgi:hypothetical protein